MTLPGLTIRFAESSDLDWCMEMEASNTFEGKNVEEDIIMDKINKREIFLAEMDGQRVGYLRLDYFSSVIPFMGLIYVKKDMQKKGIGKTLLAYVEEYLRTNGYHTLLSSSEGDEPDPQNWHKHMGFKEFGVWKKINENNSDEIFFRKTL